jgi:hypothetical protein
MSCRATRSLRHSWRASAVVLVLALLAACGSAAAARPNALGSGSPHVRSSGSSPAPPLALVQIPGDITCLVLPAPAIGVTSWRTPVAFTTDWYVNQGRRPVTVQSVALVEPHGLVLHGGLVYEMVQAEHVLYQAIAWPDLGRGALASAWRARQAIPGAVIPPGHAQGALTHLSGKDNLYVVAEEVTATGAGGGWASGERIAYTADGRSYSMTAYTGIAIGSTRVPLGDRCDSQLAAIKSDFTRQGIGQN